MCACETINFKYKIVIIKIYLVAIILIIIKDQMLITMEK